MLAQVATPEKIYPRELDQYLERGWFRMGQTIFTTNFLNFKNEFYSAIWLRVVLNEFVGDKVQQKLYKLNSKFKSEIKPASVTDVKEELYERYKRSVAFQASASLQHLLYGSLHYNRYHTFEVNIFDSDKLIASGFFDLGNLSAAGIASFYDPTYKKYSLGKYLIYLKMDYCKQLGFQYFYPGYFVPGYPLFDYKLSMGTQALEFLELRSQQWLSIKAFQTEKAPIQVMADKLTELQTLLFEKNIRSKIYKYEYFDANLIPDLQSIELLDYPMFLICSDMDETLGILVVVFNVTENRYYLYNCMSMWSSSLTAEVDDIYSKHLLKIHHEVCTSTTPDEINAAIANNLFS